MLFFDTGVEQRSVLPEQALTPIFAAVIVIVVDAEMVNRLRVICLGYFSVGIVGVNALSLGADFSRPDRPGNLCVKNLDL